MINRVLLTGRITRDSEVRKTTSGLSTTTFTLAVSKGEHTDFISCVAWRNSADYLGQYARKGDLIGVDGKLQTRSYTDKSGNNRTVTEVIAENVEIISKKRRDKEENNADNLEFNTGEHVEISNEDLPF